MVAFPPPSEAKRALQGYGTVYMDGGDDQTSGPWSTAVLEGGKIQAKIKRSKDTFGYFGHRRLSQPMDGHGNSV